MPRPKTQDPRPKTQDLLTIPQAARRLGLDVSMVRRYCAGGRIPAQRIGRDWLIRAQDLDRFIRRPSGRPAKPAPTNT